MSISLALNYGSCSFPLDQYEIAIAWLLNLEGPKYRVLEQKRR